MITKFRRKVLNDFYRPDVKKQVAELQNIQWDSMENHINRQMKNLGEILEYSKSIPYYSTFLTGIGVYSDPLAALKKIPILDKKTIIDNGDLFIHSGIKAKGRGTTSGSTGIGLSFFYDDNMLNNTETLTRFFRSWYGIEIGDRTLKIWGRPLRGYRSKLRSYFSDFLRGVKTLDPWNLSTDSLRNSWNQIIKFKPDFIYGYATSIATLAKWADLSGLMYSARKLGVKVIISTAETLLASDKQKIKDVFNCPVVEEYGAAEVSIIAHECIKGNLHIASESVFLECVDDKGNDVFPGQAGHILVTSFINRVQPLIRYRIGDYGILLSTKCSCGRGMPLMKLTGAKIIEMIKTENGRIFSAEIIDYINLALMKNSKIGIKQFRVTQKDLRTFMVEVVPDKQFNEKSKILFSKLFREQIGENALLVNFDVKEKIDPLPSGKLLYFQSEIT